MKFHIKVIIGLTLWLFVAGTFTALASDTPTRQRETESMMLAKKMDISDRAYNVIDVNKLGQYVSNIGQFYSSWNELAPTADWPLGAGHEQMYRMNVYVGVPENVVQTRTYGTKEWDPVAGYHNPDIGFLAVSNDSTTWPLNENNQPYWPVRNSNGEPIIRSHQDSYGVYRDWTNYLATQDPNKRLNITVHQSSYAWNTALDEDYVIFKFDLVNDTTVARDSVYFCLYCDFDIGGFESANEWTNDKLALDLDREFFYFYDADGWSDQWNGPTWNLGLVFLETPEVDGVRPGLTDWHYTDNWSEPRNINDDVEQYWLMSSDPRLKADIFNWPNLFHGNDIHYDDPSLIPDEGDTLIVFASSGPYYMEPGETLRIVTALVAGQDHDDISQNVDRIWEVYNNGYQVKSVPAPKVTGVAGDMQTTLRWDNRIDLEYIDPNTGTNTLKVYRIYKTEDPNRLTWNLYDSVTVKYDENSAYRTDAYEYIDNEVINGFYYSYSVTPVDSSGDESGKALLAENRNTVELRPGSDALQTTKEIRVVPNPYVISTNWERERLGNISDGEPIRELAFTNLPAECTINIFTIDGDLVKVLEHHGTGGTAYWDVRSDFNQMVATGVYFYHVKSNFGEKVGKFAIIR